MEAVEQRFGLGDGLPLHDVGHQRCRRLRDGAARSLERRLLDDAVVADAQIHRQAIAAQRVVALGLAAPGERAKIPRPLVVIQDHFLVEVFEVGHQANTSCTLASAAASASSSSRVLYSASEARAVAGTRSRSISGWQQ